MSELERIKMDEFASSPYGVHIGHTKTEVNYLLGVMQHEEIRSFIEIGVHAGGLADTVHELVDHYLGIENNESIILSEVKNRIGRNPNAEFLYTNAWTSRTILKTLKWMKLRRPSFLYCDGGDKTLELTLYAENSQPGDLVGVHDYGVYEGREIDPDYADPMMEELGFALYSPAFKPDLVRIAIWRK